jgi:hypothetical protein
LKMLRRRLAILLAICAVAAGVVICSGLNGDAKIVLNWGQNPWRTVAWDGWIDKQVVVQVLDQDGAPVRGAAVCIFSVNNPDETCSKGRTSSAGMATLDHQFTVSVQQRTFAERGSINFGVERVEVRAEGYEPISENLEQLLGDSCGFYVRPIPKLTFHLIRKY